MSLATDDSAFVKNEKINMKTVGKRTLRRANFIAEKNRYPCQSRGTFPNVAVSSDRGVILGRLALLEERAGESGVVD